MHFAVDQFFFSFSIKDDKILTQFVIHYKSRCHHNAVWNTMYYKLCCNSTQFVIYYKLRNYYKLQRNNAAVLMHIIVWIKKLYFMCMGFAELRQRGRKQDLKWKKFHRKSNKRPFALQPGALDHKAKQLLKLYCRYLYTRPCMLNHIWGLKQLWLQVNGHAWFHLQRLRWPVRNGEGAKNAKWKYMSPAGFEPTPRQSKTGKLQRLRPLGHAG